MMIDDTLLMAYVDGELSAGDRVRVEDALIADPSLLERIEAQRRLRESLSGHYAPVLDEPVPDALLASVKAAIRDRSETERARADILPFRGRLTAVARPLASLPWRQAGAMAASLLVGLVIGQHLLGGRSPQSDLLLGPDGIVADGRLELALTNQTGAEANVGDISVPISFREQDGRLCRAFVAPGTSGIACHSEAGWTVRMTAQAERALPGAVRTASTALPTEILVALDSLMNGEALSELEEEAAIEAGWRSPIR